MSEACVWINDFWFETLGNDVLRVSKAVGNTASRKSLGEAGDAADWTWRERVRVGEISFGDF